MKQELINKKSLQAVSDACMVLGPRGRTLIAPLLGKSRATLDGWCNIFKPKIPAWEAILMERITGMDISKLRPDLFTKCDSCRAVRDKRSLPVKRWKPKA